MVSQGALGGGAAPVADGMQLVSMDQVPLPPSLSLFLAHSLTRSLARSLARARALSLSLFLSLALSSSLYQPRRVPRAGGV